MVPRTLRQYAAVPSLLLEPFQEINSTLIPGTRQHFHYHSFLVSRGLVQFAIISKQDKYVNSL